MSSISSLHYNASHGLLTDHTQEIKLFNVRKISNIYLHYIPYIVLDIISLKKRVLNTGWVERHYTHFIFKQLL